MLQLLNPAAVFGIAGIAVPIFIHLWNARQGKVVKVGSIMLLEDAATRQSRSFRLTDLFLLILRCLLITVLSFLLAQPVWKKRLTIQDEKGWVLLERQNLRHAYNDYKLLVDSLLHSGYQLHVFDKGFQPASLPVLLNGSDAVVEANTSYWNLIQELNEEVPEELPIVLITGNRLQRFTASRPAVSLNLKWLVSPSADSVDHLPVAAVSLPGDSISVTTLTSGPLSTRFTTETIPGTGNMRYKINHESNSLSVGPTNQTVKIDTSVLQVVICSDGSTPDARYVKAALDAIRRSAGIAMKIELANLSTPVDSNADYLFWLSQGKLPAHLPHTVFHYATGKTQPGNSWMHEAGSLPLNEEPVYLSNITIDTNAGNRSSLWTDGYGRGLVTRSSTDDHQSQVFSIHPLNFQLWESARFPEFIYSLLQRDRGFLQHDYRQIEPSQIQPLVTRGKAFDKEKFVKTIGLEKAFWLLALFLFCVERILASRHQHQSRVVA